MQRLFFLLFLLVMIFHSRAQGDSNRTDPQAPLNSLNLNFLGDGSFLSLHFDRLIPLPSQNFLSAKLGLGFNPKDAWSTQGGADQWADGYLTVPYHLTANFGKGKHYLEVGLGGTHYPGLSGNPYYLYPLVAYRIKPTSSFRGQFRVFVQLPLIDPSGWNPKAYGGNPVFLPLGLSFGLGF